MTFILYDLGSSTGISFFLSPGLMIYASESENPEMLDLGGTSGPPNQSAGFTAEETLGT